MSNRHVQYNEAVNAPTDELLMQEFVAGDEAAFELLVRRYSQELYLFLARFTNRTIAEDLVQDTFLQVHKAAEGFDLTRRFKPWLFTIAANKARDYLRSLQRSREVPLDAGVGGQDESGQSFLDLLGATPAQDDTSWEDDGRTAFVQQVVQSLPDNLREVLVLAYFHRLPYKELSAMLNVPLGTVKSRLHSAVTLFASRYQQAVEGNPPEST